MREEASKIMCVDVKENILYFIDPAILKTLLIDRTTRKNIIWATDDYISLGEQYEAEKEILVSCITGLFGSTIRPRIEKTKDEQCLRVKDKAEVFTPSWVCNCQNNLIDNAWFGRNDVFNVELEKSWETNQDKIVFSDCSHKSWQDYVKVNRLEITCGEAPYLASRYDTVTGQSIQVKDRIGLLDRKLRVVSENVDDEEEWLKWAKVALQSVYGYDWQGDNVLLARENLLFTVIDYYKEKYSKPLEKNIKYLLELARILSWNIWQMDGLKFVVPNSCSPKCEGCAKRDVDKHDGIRCKIYDWPANKSVEFYSIYKGKNNGD